MQCKNHPDAPAVDRCVGCAEKFCENCLVELQGQKYCASCKTMALPAGGGPPPAPDEGTESCPEATEALTYAIVGIFCCAIIFAPIAISKALDAKKMIKMNPRLSGSGKATAAIVIGIIALLLWVLVTIGRVIAIGQKAD